MSDEGTRLCAKTVEHYAFVISVALEKLYSGGSAHSNDVGLPVCPASLAVLKVFPDRQRQRLLQVDLDTLYLPADAGEELGDFLVFELPECRFLGRQGLPGRRGRSLATRSSSRSARRRRNGRRDLGSESVDVFG